jgi:TFIIF-interacting CTD phosphatase-like protein
VSDYHLIFDLNGVFIAIGKGQTKACLVVIRPSLKEFLFACVKKITVYIWSLAMKRNFSKHLEIIAKKTSICFSSSRILD